MMVSRMIKLKRLAVQPAAVPSLCLAVVIEMVKVMLGALFLAGCAQIGVPWVPVPFTLTTCGLFSLALFARGRTACSAAILYLIAATLGMGVLHGSTLGSCWLLRPTFGYLIAFPLAAALTAFCYRAGLKKEGGGHRLWQAMIAIGAGQVVIYLFGVIGLSFYMPPFEALYHGCLVFLPSAVLKMLTVSLVRCRWQEGN